MSLDGLRQQEVVLVSYKGNDWYHERCLLGFVDGGVCVVTPHWDMHVEPVPYFASFQANGKGGGLPAALRSARIVRFGRAEPRRRLPQLLQDASEAEPDMEEEPPVDTTVAAAADGPVVATTVWVALENRAGF